jgi:hypothetical protein
MMNEKQKLFVFNSSFIIPHSSFSFWTLRLLFGYDAPAFRTPREAASSKALQSRLARFSLALRTRNCPSELQRRIEDA